MKSYKKIRKGEEKIQDNEIYNTFNLYAIEYWFYHKFLRLFLLLICLKCFIFTVK